MSIRSQAAAQAHGFLVQGGYGVGVGGGREVGMVEGLYELCFASCSGAEWPQRVGFLADLWLLFFGGFDSSRISHLISHLLLLLSFP